MHTATPKETVIFGSHQGMQETVSDLNLALRPPVVGLSAMAY